MVAMGVRNVAETSTEPQVHFTGPRTLEVLAVAYGVPDSYGTTWRRGVFAGSLGKRLPSVCWGHDPRRIIGSVTGWDDRAEGLVLTIRLADPADVPDAKMAASLLRDGHVHGVSVGFSGGQTVPDPRHPGVKMFVRAILQEVSLVLTPSVPGSRVLAMRSRASWPTPATRNRSGIPPHIQAALAFSRRPRRY